jgi:hypothetical protein
MPAPLLFSLPTCLLFWCAVWAAPVRAALGTSYVDALPPDLPDWPVLRRLGPLSIQRMIAQAIVTRLAWLRERHIPVLLRLEGDSLICWDDVLTRPLPRYCLREASELDLDEYVGLYTEWLVHLLNLPEEGLSQAVRLAALVGICGRLAQVYAEWRRRCGWRQARALLREALRHYLGPQAMMA